MMPLMLAGIGEENTIKKIGGSPEIKNILRISALLSAEALLS